MKGTLQSRTWVRSFTCIDCLISGLIKRFKHPCQFPEAPSILYRRQMLVAGMNGTFMLNNEKTKRKQKEPKVNAGYEA